MLMSGLIRWDSLSNERSYAISVCCQLGRALPALAGGGGLGAGVLGGGWCWCVAGSEQGKGGEGVKVGKYSVAWCSRGSGGPGWCVLLGGVVIGIYARKAWAVAGARDLVRVDMLERERRGL